MKKILLFLLKTAVIALVLFALKELLHPLYRAGIYQLCCLLPGVVTGVTLYNDSVDKVIPFAALLLATPGMPWSRKAVTLTLGLLVFLFIDVVAYFFTTPLDFHQTGVHNTPPNSLFFWVWKVYGRWLLPVLLWLLASYRHLEGLLTLQALQETTSPSITRNEV